MPGVISAMTEAGGFKDPAELFKAMENGQVKSAEVLEKFAAILAERARQGDALDKAMKSSAAEQARFNNSFSDFVVAMGGKGMDAAFASMFQTMTRFFKENPKLADGMAQAMVKLANGFEVTAKAVGDFITAFDDLGDSIGLGGTDLAMLTATVAILATHFGRVAAAGLLFVGIIQDISLGLKGQDSYTKDFIDFMNGDSFSSGLAQFAIISAGVAAFAVSMWKVVKAIRAARDAVIGLTAATTASPIVGGMVKAATMMAGTAAAAPAATGAVVAAPLLAAAALVPEENLKSESFNRMMTGRFGSGQMPQPNNTLPGINTPVMMVDKVSIEVTGTGNPEETANRVMEKMREMMKPTNLPVTE